MGEWVSSAAFHEITSGSVLPPLTAASVLRGRQTRNGEPLVRFRARQGVRRVAYEGDFEYHAGDLERWKAWRSARMLASPATPGKMTCPHGVSTLGVCRICFD